MYKDIVYYIYKYINANCQRSFYLSSDKMHNYIAYL